MPIQSKYTNKEVEVIIDELINVLSSQEKISIITSVK